MRAAGATMNARLFDVPEPEPVAKISPDRRRTMLRRTALEAGRHPLMDGPVRTDSETCGTCQHHVIQGGVAGTYHKCDLRNTGGPATDIRVSWPGCHRWEPDSEQ